MVKEKRYTKYVYANLSPTEDAEMIDFIDECEGNGNAAKTRTAMRMMWAAYKQQQGHRHTAGTAVDSPRTVYTDEDQFYRKE